MALDEVASATPAGWAPPPGARRCLTLWLIGLIAILSLLVVPMEVLQPARLHLPWYGFRLLTLINPVLLVSVTAALGCWAAPRVALGTPVLDAMLARRGVGAALRPQLLPAIVVAGLSALVLVGYARWSTPLFAGSKVPDVPMPLVTKLLYGGVVEEIITRWGLMSLFVWLAWLAGRRARPGTAAYVIGALVAAVLFGAGHLPLLFAVLPHPPATLVLAVIAGNALPGFLFGLLFWKRGLEAAMLGHALSHLFFTLAG